MESQKIEISKIIEILNEYKNSARNNNISMKEYDRLNLKALSEIDALITSELSSFNLAIQKFWSFDIAAKIVDLRGDECEFDFSKIQVGEVSTTEYGDYKVLIPVLSGSMTGLMNVNFSKEGKIEDHYCGDWDYL